MVAHSGNSNTKEAEAGEQETSFGCRGWEIGWGCSGPKDDVWREKRGGGGLKVNRDGAALFFFFFF